MTLGGARERDPSMLRFAQDMHTESIGQVLVNDKQLKVSKLYSLFIYFICI